MSALISYLKPGKVYRREELGLLSPSIDRVLKKLVNSNLLEKAAPGLYYLPKKTAFGAAPPLEDNLIEAFLKDKEYLLVSPNLYNALGVGMTQLYNTTVVYNRKRHGRFTLAGRLFDFRMKPKFPKMLSEEFLLVDLMNNLGLLAEDRETVVEGIKKKTKLVDEKLLLKLAKDYGKITVKRFFIELLKP